MFTKDLRELAGRSLTPAEAYALADPARRRAWFPDGPPELASKAASPYAPPPAAPVGLPPHLEAAVRDHQASHYADPICPRCRIERKDGGAVNGRCPHRPGPAALAEQRRWQRHADATRLVQQLAAGHLGNPVPVVDHRVAARRDAMRAELHAVIEQALGP
jgi:hypothetical protein